jgi:hypothetical protein
MTCKHTTTPWEVADLLLEQSLEDTDITGGDGVSLQTQSDCVDDRRHDLRSTLDVAVGDAARHFDTRDLCAALFRSDMPSQKGIVTSLGRSAHKLNWTHPVSSPACSRFVIVDNFA